MKPLFIVMVMSAGSQNQDLKDLVFRGGVCGKEKTSSTVQHMSDSFKDELAPAGSVVSEYDQLKKRLEAFKVVNDQLVAENAKLERELKQLQNRVFSVAEHSLESVSRQTSPRMLEQSVQASESSSRVDSDGDDRSRSPWMLDISHLINQPGPCVVKVGDVVFDSTRRVSSVVFVPKTPLKKDEE